MPCERIFCKVKIEFTFISEERLCLFDSREWSNHMRPKYIKTILTAPRGQSETNQLELSLKSHAFQRFTDLIDTISQVPCTHKQNTVWIFYILIGANMITSRTVRPKTIEYLKHVTCIVLNGEKYNA